RCKTIESMSELYRKTYNFKHHKILCSSVPVYRTPDDHDRHMNNCNLETKERDPIGFANASRAYQLYQHHLGPASNYIEHNEIWRDVNINKLHHRDSTFFIMDCRSDRNEICYLDSINNFSTIISFRQMKDFEQWIEKHRDNNEMVKFVVTSVPLLSQDTNDSWYGFPEQQKKVIDLILSVRNIFVLTGDAHCCRSGTYSIYNYEDRYLGKITEILSSGLFAVNHDRGKPFNETIATEEYINDYNKNNDFPYIVDNSINNKGYKMVTDYATPCYPRPNKARGINVIKQLFCRVIDNTFIKIKVLDNDIEVEIFNQDGRSLHLNRYELY
ncbi:MAG: alkaline phosphatase D family protein, partial [Romboutsia sp.]|nr:alkaline phosphatase D family protein [Romboutsia sp.]